MKIKEECACCKHFTVEGMFDICPICFWQKDSFQEKHNFDNGGPNMVCLLDAQENYKKYAVSEERFKEYVRRPTDAEL